MTKSERLQSLNEQIFKEMQEYKLQLVGVHEIKKDRDDRLDKLRTELTEITHKYDVLDKEHTSLKVNFDHICEEHKTLKGDYDAVSEMLRLSNKIKNDKEEMLAEKVKTFNILNENYVEKE